MGSKLQAVVQWSLIHSEIKEQLSNISSVSVLWQMDKITMTQQFLSDNSFASILILIFLLYDDANLKCIFISLNPNSNKINPRAGRHTLPLPAQSQPSISRQQQAREWQNQINLNGPSVLGRQMKQTWKTCTLSRCSFPPELLVQIKKCFVNKKHCLSPSFFKDSEPRRTLLSFPLSTEGT